MYKKNSECLQGGCFLDSEIKCKDCGFNPMVALVREKIPLTRGKDGRYKKVLVKHEE